MGGHHSRFTWLYPIRDQNGQTQWFYCWFFRNGTGVPPDGALDMTGKTVQYDYMFELVDGRPQTNQILNFRMYSGYFDEVAGKWVLEGFEDWAGVTPPIPGKWYHEQHVQGTGTITNSGGEGYNPAKIYYWRFHGTDWDQVDGDRVGIDNLVMGDAPVTRTAVQDYDAADPWINWNFLYWNPVADTAEIATLPQGGGNDTMFRPWHAYRVWANTENTFLVIPQP